MDANSLADFLSAIDNSFIARTVIVSVLFVLIAYLLVLIVARASFMFRVGNQSIGFEMNAQRRAYEGDVFAANRKLTADAERFEDVNHLVLAPELDNVQSGLSVDNSPLSSSFFSTLGIDRDKMSRYEVGSVFVLTPFHPEFDETFEKIRSVLSDLNYRVSRGDELVGSGSILKHIVEKIFESEIIVANIDGRNPNVYYELGIAQAIGKNVILLSSEVESLPFDFKTQRLVVWKDKADLEKGLLRVFARIGVRSGSSRGKN